MAEPQAFIHHLARVVEKFPEKAAVEDFQGETLTYRQLWQRAAVTAAALRSEGLTPGETIALLLPRSADFIVGLIGGWLAQLIVLPLDPSTPEARLRHIFQQSAPRIILQREARFFACPGSEQDALVKVPTVALHDPAYLIYTSGSSGEPKAALLSHENLVPLLLDQIALFELDETSRALWVHGLGFDASLSDIGTALLAGATLCLDSSMEIARDPEFLLDQLTVRKITHIDLPPALLEFLDVERKPATLRTIVIGGQVCHAEAVRRWAARCRVVNVYGPTEATICTSMIVCDENWSRPLIGQPVSGVTYHVHSADGSLTPFGTAGELWIEGPCVGLGYPFHRQLEEQRFDFSGSQRVYRTGDLVVAHPDGIEFLGRLDRQVKVHGKLVCPEEVEAAIRAYEPVTGAYVFVSETSRLPVLTACVEAPASLSLQALQVHLRTRLPPGLIPSKWIVADSIPTLSNGKPDRNAINALAHPSAPAGESPSTDPEKLVAELFLECLGRPGAGRQDDFFELGGDSLGVIAFICGAQQRGRHVSADVVYRGRTVAGIAGLLADSSISEAMGIGQLDEKVRSAFMQLAPIEIAVGGKACSIFITGATGFLGSAVLGELLQSTSRPIVCLVRDEEAVAKNRVIESLKRHGYPTESLFERCRWVKGDAGLPLFGLPALLWNQLAGECSLVFHLAADTRLFQPYATLQGSNIQATCHIVNFCLSGVPKQLHYASTLSVFVDADPVCAVCLENDLRRDITTVHGGYAQTKWVAEQLVLRARDDKNLEGSIYRFGLLTANSRSGYCPERDWFALFLRDLNCGGSEWAASSHLKVDVTPVDYAARAMVWLALNAPCDIYHLANAKAVSLPELIEAVAPTTPARQCGAMPLSVQRTRSHRTLDLFKATGTAFSMANTSRGLAGSGIIFPAITPDYLRSCRSLL